MHLLPVRGFSIYNLVLSYRIWLWSHLIIIISVVPQGINAFITGGGVFNFKEHDGRMVHLLHIGRWSKSSQFDGGWFSLIWKEKKMCARSHKGKSPYSHLIGILRSKLFVSSVHSCRSADLKSVISYLHLSLALSGFVWNLKSTRKLKQTLDRLWTVLEVAVHCSIWVGQ